jgi:hypothetical protein
MNAETQDRIDRIREAQELLREAIDLLKSVARETNDGHARAYLIDHLECFTSSDHGFLSRDFNCDKWVEQLEEEDAEADEDAEYEALQERTGDYFDHIREGEGIPDSAFED